VCVCVGRLMSATRFSTRLSRPDPNNRPGQQQQPWLLYTHGHNSITAASVPILFVRLLGRRGDRPASQRAETLKTSQRARQSARLWHPGRQAGRSLQLVNNIRRLATVFRPVESIRAPRQAHRERRKRTRQLPSGASLAAAGAAEEFLVRLADARALFGAGVAAAALPFGLSQVHHTRSALASSQNCQPNGRRPKPKLALVECTKETRNGLPSACRANRLAGPFINVVGAKLAPNSSSSDNNDDNGNDNRDNINQTQCSRREPIATGKTGGN
jgi:hypothetical protein